VGEPVRAAGVLICTRNRGAAVCDTIESVVRSTPRPIEIVVVDQSDDDATGDAVAALDARHGVRYVRSDTRGLSAARNVGLALVTNEIVAMTDDDCIVGEGWIEALEAEFATSPAIACVFTRVTAGAHDAGSEFVPVSDEIAPVVVSRLADYIPGMGIGASMAVDRRIALAIGGFDTELGAGGRFRSGEDHDFGLRLSASGHAVSRITDVAVVHHGARAQGDIGQLIRGAVYGCFVIHGKMLRWRGPRALRPFGRDVHVLILAPTIDALRQRRVPRVAGRVLYGSRGLLRGLTVRVDRVTGLFRKV
jgi:glycosyltransferase involved in cell wall biosynthesis